MVEPLRPHSDQVNHDHDRPQMIQPRGSSVAGAVAAFFDLDDTLLAGDSDLIWYDYLAGLGRIGWRERLWVNWHYWLYHLGRTDVDTYVAMQTRTIAGLPIEQVRSWYDDCFLRITRQRFFPEAHDLIVRHRQQGHRLVLCTGMNTLRCEPVRQYLGLDTVLGTELEIRDGRCSGQIVGRFCTGSEKVARIEQDARAHGVDLTASYAYGDSHGDRLMLEAVGHPAAVNPNRPLEAIARSRGWPIIRFTPPRPHSTSGAIESATRERDGLELRKELRGR